MLATKGYGLSVDDIDWSSPADMEPYLRAYKVQKNEQDLLQWQMGQYMAAAVSCVFPKGKYPKKPMFQVEESIKKNGNTLSLGSKIYYTVSPCRESELRDILDKKMKLVMTQHK